MRFSIVTPSRNQQHYLRRCISSVADQPIDHEHIVQDCESNDGTLEWLLKDARVRACVEKDDGMYDAVNRGLRRAQGELLAYLNCDEQYLTGALPMVAAWFDAHADVDVLFGDVIFVSETCDYVAHRKMQTPLKYHTWTCHLSTLTCATFFRRSILERGFYFDPRWRTSGDGEWMVRMLNAGVRMAALGSFTSVFTRTKSNLSLSATAVREAERLRQTAPRWARVVRPAFVAQHRLRRWLGGMYRQAPFNFDVYTSESLNARKTREVPNPVART